MLPTHRCGIRSLRKQRIVERRKGTSSVQIRALEQQLTLSSPRGCESERPFREPSGARRHISPALLAPGRNNLQISSRVRFADFELVARKLG
jgi:hypothetical protein